MSPLQPDGVLPALCPGQELPLNSGRPAFYHSYLRNRFAEEKRFDPAGTGPNVLPWAEWEYYQNTGDRVRLARVFPPLAAYTRWFRQNRTWPDGSYWGTRWSTGMDNQPRLAHDLREWYEHGHQTWVNTCVPPVAVRFEHVSGLRPQGLDRLLWDLRHLESHGVDRYPLGPDNSLDLHCCVVEVRWSGGIKVLHISSTA